MRGAITVDLRHSDEVRDQVIAGRSFGECLPERRSRLVRAEIRGRIEVDSDHLTVDAAPLESLTAQS